VGLGCSSAPAAAAAAASMPCPAFPVKGTVSSPPRRGGLAPPVCCAGRWESLDWSQARPRSVQSGEEVATGAASSVLRYCVRTNKNKKVKLLLHAGWRV